jgi:leucyl aminopeptidase
MERKATSVKVLNAELGNVNDDYLLIGFFKGKLGLRAEVKKLDDKLNNMIHSCIANNGFNCDKGEIRNLYVNKNIKNIVLVGLGEDDKFDYGILTNAIADVSRRLRDNKAGSFSIYLNSFNNGKLNENDVVEKTALSSLMGLYKFTEYKTKDNGKTWHIRQITIITDSNKTYGSEIGYASVVADAVSKTRNLINTPPNVATPEYVADYAKKLAKASKLKFRVFEEKQIASMGMGCFMGVAQGSANKPRLVVLEYNGAGKNKKPIAIVGKGVTFDSGGLNLKPYPFILNMKDDKGGAVAAMHIIEACSRLNLGINIIAVAPLCENMPGGSSFRPDDVLKAYNGMTVEIKNTDAEGRLILADALSYAAKLKPQAIIDIATLTGASLIALGYAGTPFLSTDEKLAEKIKDASKKSLEKVWEFPLWQEYEESLKSDVADLKHIGDDGEAGVIIGATFLKNFVDEAKWAHIDIGTTVWSKVDKGVLTKGATGATVRLMMELLRNWRQ